MKIVFKRFAIGSFHNFIFMAKKGADMFWDGGGVAIICHCIGTPNKCLWMVPNAVVNGHLELPLLKDRQRFDAVSTSNLEVLKFRDWWILTYFIFGHGESSLNNFWSRVNLERTCVLLFYYFLCLKANLEIEKKISLVNLHPTLFSQWWILTLLFWKRGELMVNPDLTILLKRWTEVKTWGG